MRTFLCVLGLITLGNAQAQQGPFPVTVQAGATISLSAGANPSAVAVADFNQDRRPDVAVCEKGPGVAAIYPQSVTGTFPAVSATYSLGVAPTGLVAMRLNNPNRPAIDLVGVSGPSSRWTFLFNDDNGKATFHESPVPPPQFGTSALSTNPQLLAAYLDGDNYMDLAYTYDGVFSILRENRVEYRAYKGGTLLERHLGFEANLFPPTSLAIADFDKDGTTDAVTTDTGNNKFWVIYADRGNNNASEWYGDYYSFGSSGSRPIHVATGDVNQDYRPDIVVANSGSNTATVFLNVGSTRFGSEVSYALSGAPRRVLLKDLNNDNYDDLVVITADNKLQIFQHTQQVGVGRYITPQTFATGSDPVTLDYADIDGDAHEDIIVGCAGDNTVRVYLNKTFATVTATGTRQLFGIEVYPNPAKDQLVIRGAAAENQPLQATLVDGLGRTVLTADVQPQNRIIPVGNLPRGLYLLRLTSTQGTTTKRIVLE